MSLLPTTTLGAEDSPDGSTQRDDAAASDFKPFRVGDYEIERELGRGGMGVVYQARQISLNRKVAVKMILAGSVSRSAQRQRFLAEARAVAKLRHPNIVAVHEIGEHDGQPFYSMEFVKGRSLAELIQEHSLPARRAAAWVKTITEAVQHAHAHGILHRDLKPSNVLIDDAGQPRITDFGLAKDLLESSELTLSGQTIGSPAYLPPEQVGGRRGEVGPAGDIYGLGAILYHLLTGRPPFMSEHVQATLLQVMESEPASPRSMDSGIPRDLETICLKCLEKRPARRYASASEVADELGRFLEGRPIIARPVGKGERILRWTRRNLVLATVSALLVTALALGFAATAWQWRRADDHAARLAATVTRLKLDQAEDRLTEGKTAEGLALLAALLREDPNNRVAAQRVVSALHQRNFLRPQPWLAADQQFRWASAFAVHDHLLMTSTNEGRALTLWDVTNEPRLMRQIEVGEPVRLSTFSRDARQSVVATEDKRLFLYDLADGSLRAGPYPLEGFAEQLLLSPDASLALVVTVPDFQSDNHYRAQGAVVELATGRRLHEEISFHWAAFSPDDRWLVTVHRGEAALRDARTWQPLGEPIKARSRINMAEFSPDSKALVTAGASANATLWEVESGRPLIEFNQPVSVLAAYFSPDGEVLFTYDVAGRGRLWDVTTGRMLGAPFSQTKGFGPDSFSPDGRRFLSYGADGLIVRDTRTAEPLSEPFNAEGVLTRARFLADGRRFITTSFSHAVRLWDAAPTALAPAVFRDELEVEHAALSPDGTKVATGIKGSWARVWDVAETKPIGDWLKHNATVLRVGWSPDSRFVVTASRDHTARVWNAESTQPVGEVMRHEGPVRHAEFSPDGRWVATASEDQTARVWDAITGQATGPPLRHEASVQSAQFSPDGAFIATAGRDGTVRFWSVPEGKPLGEPIRGDHHFRTLHFSGDGRLATSGEDRYAQVWDVPKRKLLFPPIAHASVANSIRFDPEGTRVVTASSDGTARVWDAFRGHAISKPMRHEAGVIGADFSLDGRFVLTISSDKTARVWDAATGQPVTDPLRHDARVIAGQWATDGSGVLTASYDRTAKFWPLVLVPEGPAPSWLAALAEACGSLRVTGDDVFQRMEIQDVVGVHARVRAVGRFGAWGECAVSLASAIPSSPDPAWSGPSQETSR